MSTEYIHSVTIAIPAGMMGAANHLACLLGESAADINTFKTTTYTDGTVEYAVAHTVVKDVFVAPTLTGQLPVDPDHVPAEYDRSQAEAAFLSLAQPGGILMALNVDPHQQFVDWGLTRLPVEALA